MGRFCFLLEVHNTWHRPPGKLGIFFDAHNASDDAAASASALGLAGRGFKRLVWLMLGLAVGESSPLKAVSRGLVILGGLLLCGR